MIRKEGDKYKVLSRDGKKQLGEYKTRAEALTRLRQIEYFKHEHGKEIK